MIQCGALPLCPCDGLGGGYGGHSYARWLFRRGKALAQPRQMGFDTGQNLFPLDRIRHGPHQVRQRLGPAGRRETRLTECQARGLRKVAHLDGGRPLARFRPHRRRLRWNSQADHQNHPNETSQDHAGATGRPATGPALYKSDALRDRRGAGHILRPQARRSRRPFAAPAGPHSGKASNYADKAAIIDTHPARPIPPSPDAGRLRHEQACVSVIFRIYKNDIWEKRY